MPREAADREEFKEEFTIERRMALGSSYSCYLEPYEHYGRRQQTGRGFKDEFSDDLEKNGSGVQL